MPDVPDEEWDRLTADLDEANARAHQLADAMLSLAEEFNRAVGKARPAITLDEARRLQGKVTEATAWLHGVAKLLDPDFPVEWGEPG